MTPLNILEAGLDGVANKIISKCGVGSQVYLSIDLDCIDSVIAPGVSVPALCGIMPLEVIFLVKKICSKLKIIGFDLVELCPDFDFNNNTAAIAARLILETLALILREELQLK